MRVKITIFLIIIISSTINSQNPAKKRNFSPPPGTIKINDSLYIDVVPINNLMYKEFIHSIDFYWNQNVHEYTKTIRHFGLSWETLERATGFNKKKYKQKVLRAEKLNLSLIDSTNLYIRHPIYQYFPVLNITKDDAKLYCKWRTDMVKLIWAINSKTKKARAKYPKNILYRLPSTDEYNNAINYFGFSKKKKLKPYSLKPIYPYLLSNKKKYKKALFYKRNISEYTSDSIPFGKNWKNKKNFTSFNDYTGFRCVCEIKNR